MPLSNSKSALSAISSVFSRAGSDESRLAFSFSFSFSFCAKSGQGSHMRRIAARRAGLTHLITSEKTHQSESPTLVVCTLVEVSTSQHRRRGVLG